MNRAIVLACIAGGAFGSTTFSSAIAYSDGPNGQTCYESSSRSADCSVSGPTGAGAGAEGYAWAGFLSLYTSAEAAGAASGGPYSATIAVSASYDYWVVINGGTGSDMLTVTYDETFSDYRIQPSQGLDTESVTCPALPVGEYISRIDCFSNSFTYGVPFEMSASSSIQWEANSGDNGFYSEADFTFVSAEDQNGNPLTLVVADPATVPEPSTLTLCGLAIAGLWLRRRIATWQGY